MNIKVPVSWLREYLKTDVAAKTIAGYLSLSGPSVERIEKQNQDYIFEIEVTTNRPDAFSVFGIAREAYAILSAENQKTALIQPKGLNQNLQPETSSRLPLDVIIKNKSLCLRFSAIVLDNVKIQPSPALIKNRLEACGIRAINNIVDISNYLMLEMGQPMHAFDYDKIKNHRLILRESEENERVTTLDGQTRKLPKGAIVIENENRLIDLCGIMGAQNSEISRRTKKVLLFVQAYDSLRIRKTTRALAFRTEAATRFEKGIDLEAIIPALSRAVYLAKKTAGAKIASELIDIANSETKTKSITLNLNKLKEYLGIELETQKAEKNLKLLGFQTKISSQTITATPPSFRASDIQNDVDLIEEIARIYGYWRLPSKLPAGEIPDSPESDLSQVIKLKEALKYLGLTEVISYSIISKELLDLTQTKPQETIKLANPLSVEWQYMRPTALVSLANIVGQNQKFQKKLKLFEVAKTYIPSVSSSKRRESDLPKQDLILSIIFSQSDFYEIKGIVGNVFEVLRRNIKWETPINLNPIFEKDQSAQIKIGDTPVGTVGILNSQIADHFEIEGKLAAAEINLTASYQLPATSYHYTALPKYPPVIEDISAVFDEKTPSAQIIEELIKAGSPLVKKIEIIDVFRDQKMGEHKKSVTLRFNYQKSTGTPTPEEVKEAKDKIIDTLSKTFIAILRK